MIKDHALSEKLIQNAQEATKVIHQSLFWVMDSRPQEEFVKYRLAVAHTFSAIFDNITAPLSAEHPDLDPLKKIEKEEIQSREDNVPAYDKDAPPMLERLYHIHNDDGSTTGLNLHLSKPAKSKDGDDWYCTYQVASELGTLKKKAFGIDGLHSYQVAITNIKLYIDNTIGSKKITWAGGEGTQLN